MGAPVLGFLYEGSYDFGSMLGVLIFANSHVHHTASICVSFYKFVVLFVGVLILRALWYGAYVRAS